MLNINKLQNRDNQVDKLHDLRGKVNFKIKAVIGFLFYRKWSSSTDR